MKKLNIFNKVTPEHLKHYDSEIFHLDDEEGEEIDSFSLKKENEWL